MTNEKYVWTTSIVYILNDLQRLNSINIMEGDNTQDPQSRVRNEGQENLGKAETPPPTYADACHFILTGRHPSLSPSRRVSLEPPPEYQDVNFSAATNSLENHTQYVHLSSDQLDIQNSAAQDTMVIANEEDFPRTCSICKKIAAYLVAIFWISISSIQLLMGVGVAHHYHFEKFLYGGSNRAYGNAMFMFWMMTLFANIVLLFGIINKNR